ncbi:hypothetical protein SDC9_166401 [bioreactor metagenome]|uniref:Uncharacterized protein n=1 Tax=bioreactor metagenome TaxID=1076179 RepID=A0A645FX67_9ZZZZ
MRWRVAARAQHQCRHQQRGQQASRDGTGQPGDFGYADEEQHAAGIKPCERAQQHAGQILAARVQTLQLVLEAAGRDQPDQGAGQAGSGEQGRAAKPLPERVRTIDGGRAHHHLYKQHGAQYHAGIAGVEHQDRAGRGGSCGDER